MRTTAIATWTEKRDRMLTLKRAAGTPDDNILVILNAMPGRKIKSLKALNVRAIKIRAGKGRSTKWPEERKARLLSLYQAGAELREILTEVNKLPGAPVASVSGIRRQLEKMLVAPRRSRPETPGKPIADPVRRCPSKRPGQVADRYQPFPQPPFRAGTQYATMDEVQRWCIDHGFFPGMPAPLINSERRLLGLPEFYIMTAAEQERLQTQRAAWSAKYGRDEDTIAC